MWFVNSMSDLFHEDVPDAWILKVLDVIRATSHDGGANCGSIRNADRTEGQHVYQVLTKRSARMRNVMRRLRWDGERLSLADDDSRARVILRNLWLGVSAEDQRRADERVPDLLATPAAVRFVSAEPLLGPLDFTRIAFDFGTDRMSRHNALRGVTNVDCRTRLDWIIVGGESGQGARPMHPDWARGIRDQCEEAGTAYFFKQWGGWKPVCEMEDTETNALYRSNRKAKPHERQEIIDELDGRTCTVPTCVIRYDGRAFHDDTFGGFEVIDGHYGMSMYGIGKKAAGRLLDGREWNEMPKQSAEASA